MKNYRLPSITLVVLSVLVYFVPAAQAGTPPDFDPAKSSLTGQPGLIDTTTGNLSTALNLGTASPIYIAFSVVNAALSLMGAFSLILLVYAGFIWIWARGKEEEVTKAKDIIKGTIIGLIIVMASLGITNFIFVQIGNITGATVQTSK